MSDLDLQFEFELKSDFQLVNGNAFPGRDADPLDPHKDVHAVLFAEVGHRGVLDLFAHPFNVLQDRN